MKTELVLITLLFLLSSFVNAFAQHGRWIGAIDFGGNQLPLAVVFDGAAGTAELISEGLSDLKVTDAQFKGFDAAFKVSRGELVFEFHGKINGSSMSGEVTSTDAKGSFQLMKIAAISRDQKAKLFGVYRFQPDRQLYVRTWDELGKDQLTAFDSDGFIYALHAKSPTQFFSGPGIMISSPVKDEFEFVESPDGFKVNWKTGGKAQTGTKITTIQEEQVSITNDSATLSASCVKPEGDGPFPGVVLVHGSGMVTRDFFGPLAYMLASRGIAVVSYDKRENWMDSSFESLASDAAAALKWLRMQKKIDLKKTGFLGISQGGWIIPVAASLVPETGFAILISAAGVTPAEQEMMRQQEEMKAAGASNEEVEAAMAQLKGQLDWVRKEDSAKELEQEVEKLKKAGKEAELKSAGIDNPVFLLWYRKMMDFTPIPFLQKTKAPVLAIYGELDRAVPADSNSAIIRKALSEAENKRVKIHIFPGGNHALLESKTGSRKEFAQQTRFVNGFFDLVSKWILSL